MVFATAREDVVLGAFAAVWFAEAEEVVILATAAFAGRRRGVIPNGRSRSFVGHCRCRVGDG
jgi:hypothetical protein